MKNVLQRFSHPSRRNVSALVCVSAALASVMLTGCDNDSAEARNAAATQTEKAASELENLSLMSVYPMTASRREDMRTRYGKFLSEYGTVPTNAMAEQQAQLNAMVAEVHLGLNRLALDEAGDVEKVVNHEMVLVVQDLGAAIDLNSMAKAASKVDFSKTKAAIEQQEQLSLQQQNDLRKQAGDIQASMDDLQKQIDAELAVYDQMSNEAAARKDEALAAPLDEQRDILEEAAIMSRRADGHQVKAANLETALDLIKPKLSTVFSRIDQTETELTSFKASKEVLAKRESAAAQTAAARREDLNGENGKVNKIKNELDVIYGNVKTNVADSETASYKDVVAVYDEAITEAETAVAKASSSRKSPGGEVRLIEAYQALGTAQWRKAVFLKSVSYLVSRMADEAGLLGRGEVDRALKQTIEADIQGAMTAAGEAFTKATEAADRISSRNIDDRTKHRLVSDLNDTVVAITGQGAVEVAPMEEKREELPAPTEETTVGGDDPRGLIQQIIAMQKQGKFSELYDLIYADTATEQDLLNLSRTLALSLESLNATCEKKLGVPLADADHDINSILTGGMEGGGAAAMGDTSGLGSPADAFAKLTDDDVNNLEFGFDAGKTTAWITNNQDLSQINFVKDGGDWKIDFNIPLGNGTDQEQMIQQMMGFIKSLMSSAGDGMSTLEDQVNNGSLTDIDAVREALGKVMSDAIQNIMGKAMEEAMKKMPQNQPSGGKGGSGGN